MEKQALKRPQKSAVWAAACAAGLTLTGCGLGTHASTPPPSNASSTSVSVPPYHPSLPASVHGKTVAHVKISRTLYETVVDSTQLQSPAYIQFDHYDPKTGQWKTVWSGKAPSAPNLGGPPNSYLQDLSSIVPQKDGSKLVTPVFVSTGDGSGSTADVFYVNPSETSVAPVTTLFGPEPKVVPMDQVRAGLLGASPGSGVVAFTGYRGDVLSYNPKARTVHKAPITNAHTLLALEADGKPYVMITIAPAGKLTYTAENGASYHMNGSSLVVSSGASVGFDLGLDPNLLLFSNAAQPTSPLAQNNASIVPNLMIPSTASGGAAFDVGIANLKSQGPGFLQKLHIGYGAKTGSS